MSWSHHSVGKHAGHFLDYWCGSTQSTVDSTTWASGSEFYKKTEHITESKSVNNISPWSLLQFLPWDQTPTSFYDNCQLYDVTDHLLLLITFGHGVCYRKRKQTENYLPSSSNTIRHIPFIFSKLEIEKQAHNLIPNLLLSCTHFFPDKPFSFRATIIIMMIKIIIFENFLWLLGI